MKKLFLALIFSLIFLSCKQKEEEKVAEQPETATIIKENKDGDFCYLKVVSRDSIILNYTRKGDSISGIFNWLPYEKDKKISTFKGTIKGNSATAVGHYFSEGMEYHEELIFTITGNQAAVKFGEMIESDNGVWRYKNINKASVQNLNKVTCK